MPRDRRPARMERVGNLAGRPRPAAQQVQDVAARLVGKRAEDAACPAARTQFHD